MKTIAIIGAGQLGSRHLQALRALPAPVAVWVMDPSHEALQVARERYESFSATFPPHPATYSQDFNSAPEHVDLAIFASNSDDRAASVEALFRRSKVDACILEKILFHEHSAYSRIGNLLQNAGCRAWVNCTMRATLFYRSIKEDLGPGPICYRVSGSRYGLVTNSIHYLDHLAHLSGCTVFSIVTDGLDPCPVPSKRRGFLELNGTIRAKFKDGSHCSITCHPNGTAPLVVGIESPALRCISRETEGKAWVACESKDWAWEEREAIIPYQSQMTNRLAEQIFSTGTCPLVTYEESCGIHLSLLDALARFLDDHAARSSRELYPFT
jgi:hypothetical protein